MELSGIDNLVLGGGLVATIAAIITLKSTVRKAKAEAEKATAEAETVRIDNTEKATRVLIENIVNPLKEELNETRKVLRLDLWTWEGKERVRITGRLELTYMHYHV